MDKDNTIDIGRTFTVTDPATGRSFVGFGESLDIAVADAMHQWNAARACELRIRYVVRSFTEGLR